MKNKISRRSFLAAAAVSAAALAVSGCDAKKSKKEVTDITVWNYYNGDQLESFNRLVSTFNETIGKEKGIRVTGSSQGTVNDLEANVMDAAEGKVGSAEMPTIFAAYADTAYKLDQMGMVVDLKDYLYSGEELRKLEGKKFVKKRNHLNGFKRTYEGRYEYRRLCCSDRHEVWQFMERWRQHKEEVGAMELSLDYEVAGIHDILKNCSSLYVRMAGVYIDGQLEAFTIGSLNVRENMAVIHIEKANPEIRGLYQFINQQFLINEFPEAELVNREDDVGMEGLRKAKMSYCPIGFARKYMVRER